MKKKKAKEKHFLPVNLKIYHFVVAIEREAKKSAQTYENAI